MPGEKKDKKSVFWKKGNFWIIIFTGGLFIVAFLSLYQQYYYYKETTRPFINIVEHSIKLLNPDIVPKDNIGIEYIIKNYGNLPAKDVQSRSEFYSYEDSTYRKEFKPGGVIYSIYPNMTQLKQNREMKRKFNNENRSYLHIAITYKDVNKKEYYSLSIIQFHFEYIKDKKEPVYQHIKSYFD